MGPADEEAEMPSYRVTGDDDWEPLADEEQAADRVDDSLGRVEELGLDQEAVAGTMMAFVAEGADAVDALELAVHWHDHSDAKDELEALAKISEREGWR
jgi:hypothetical protein